MQLISKFNKGFRCLLCAIDIYCKYVWVILLKDKKGITITNAFQNILDESNCKPSKIWVDKGSEIYNRPMKSWLEKNDTEMYSIHNEGKSVVVERLIRTLKNKIYKYMTSISKNVNTDKLDYIFDKCNNKYHSAIKMKPVNVKSSTYIDSSKKIIIKILNLKLVILLEYQHGVSIFGKGYTPNWCEEVSVIKKVKNTLPWTCVSKDLNGKEIVGTFYENEFQKAKQKEFRTEKVIKRKGDELYVKWKDTKVRLIGG